MIKLLLSCYEVIILFVFFYVNMLYGFIMTSAGREVSQNTVSDYVEALTERAGKKSQYVRERIVLTLPVSDRQGIFLPIFRTKNLEKGQKIC